MKQYMALDALFFGLLLAFILFFVDAGVKLTLFDKDKVAKEIVAIRQLKQSR